MLIANNPVISVNGNVAALVTHELVQLSKAISAKLEVNIFHPSKKRELRIKNEPFHLINVSRKIKTNKLRLKFVY